MLFNSFSFLVFFPIVIAVYYVIPKKCRQVWLLICSYYFYMSWNPRYALLILFSTIITYACGLLIDRADTLGKKKGYIAVTMVANLGILFIFKYLDFALETVADALAVVGIGITPHTFDLLLPVGISFYTFQTIGYIIDVYRQTTKAEKQFVSYALFVSFFPQLVAGPIERSSSLLSELHKMKTADLWDQERNARGFLLMLWGYFQKMVIADRLAILIDHVYENSEMYSGSVLAVASIFFAIQIYCDFAGYTNIARGAAAILGVKLMNNFRQPYFSKSVKEFWSRWHISLSSWFRDYLYFPLGGSRKGDIRKYINLMIVFLVSGLWHGAAYTYIAWGILHGLYRIAEELLHKGCIWWKKRKESVVNDHRRHEKLRKQVGNALKVIITFVLVDIAWIFFRAETLGQALDICERMILCKPDLSVFFNGTLFTLGLDAKDFGVAIVAVLILLIVDTMQYAGVNLYDLYRRRNVIVRTVAVYVMIFALLIWGIYGPGYDAAQFIYFQF